MRWTRYAAAIAAGVVAVVVAEHPCAHADSMRPDTADGSVSQPTEKTLRISLLSARSTLKVMGMNSMYVRFGALPEGGRSWNDEAQSYEAGISCYRAEWQSTDRDVVCVYIPSDICIGTISQIEDRPVYIVTGDLLDVTGGDGEPLMGNAAAELVGPVEVVTYCIEAEA